ncbi:unnamed protein product [Vicia faba]|uniref:Uncharacterized protein n=1 Tax=Vicia faba TaxID=3906 RepID=A0AAV1BCX5_VICFA|nr:unnamed protein product [Vicia faba]
MPSPKPTSESEIDASYSDNIGQIPKDVSQQEIVPRASVLKELASHLIEVSSSKSSFSLNTCSEFDNFEFRPLVVEPLQVIHIETKPSDPQQNVQTSYVESHLTKLAQTEILVQSETEQIIQG